MPPKIAGHPRSALRRFNRVRSDLVALRPVQHERAELPPKRRWRGPWLTAIIAVVSFIVGGASVAGVVQARVGAQVLNAIGQQPLVLVSSIWPYTLGCISQPFAMPVSGFDPMAFSRIVSVEDAVASGAATFEQGRLVLRITGRDDTTITVSRVFVDIRLADQSANPDWIYYREPGDCGGVSQRFYDIDLTGRSTGAVDLETVKVDEGGTSGPPDFSEEKNFTGQDFTVSATDPATIVIKAVACRGLYEWTAGFEYTYLGDTYTLTIGSPESPFRSMGQVSSSVFYEQPIGTDVPLDVRAIAPGDCMVPARSNTAECDRSSFPSHIAAQTIDLECSGPFAAIRYTGNGVSAFQGVYSKEYVLTQLYERGDDGWVRISTSYDDLLTRSSISEEAEAELPDWFES